MSVLLLRRRSLLPVWLIALLPILRDVFAAYFAVRFVDGFSDYFVVDCYCFVVLFYCFVVLFYCFVYCRLTAVCFLIYRCQSFVCLCRGQYYFFFATLFFGIFVVGIFFHTIIRIYRLISLIHDKIKKSTILRRF